MALMSQQKSKKKKGKHGQRGQEKNARLPKRRPKNMVLWLVVLLMLATMLMYVWSDDEALPPGGQPDLGEPRLPAAAE